MSLHSFATIDARYPKSRSAALRRYREAEHAYRCASACLAAWRRTNAPLTASAFEAYVTDALDEMWAAQEAWRALR